MPRHHLDIQQTRSFAELKENSAGDFEYLKALMRLDLGTHKEDSATARGMW